MNLKNILATSAFFAFFCVAQAQALHVVLDPGHGGHDKGATRGKITESFITLRVAGLVADELKKDSDFKVSMTRKSDIFLELEERASFANKQGDLFLSIHVNSSADPKARGHEIYFQNQLPPDQESLFLASRENSNSESVDQVARSVCFAVKSRPHLNSDIRAIVEDLERNHRFRLSGLLTESLYETWGGDYVNRKQPIRQAPFFVVSNIDKPSALVEIGYLSNENEAQKLMDPVYQKRIAIGIYKALRGFKERTDKELVLKKE